MTVDGLDKAFVPRLSPLILHLMLEPPNQLVVSPEIDDILRQILALEANFNWESWEKFLALHLALMSCLYAHLNVSSVTVGELFAGATVIDPSVLQKRIPTVARVVRNFDLTEQTTSTFEPNHTDAVKYANSVVMSPRNNPGFDVAMPYLGNQWLLVEAKYSASNAETSTSVPQIVKKCGLIERGQNALPGM